MYQRGKETSARMWHVEFLYFLCNCVSTVRGANADRVDTAAASRLSLAAARSGKVYGVRPSRVTDCMNSSVAINTPTSWAISNRSPRGSSR